MWNVPHALRGRGSSIPGHETRTANVLLKAASYVRYLLYTYIGTHTSNFCAPPHCGRTSGAALCRTLAHSTAAKAIGWTDPVAEANEVLAKQPESIKGVRMC